MSHTPAPWDIEEDNNEWYCFVTVGPAKIQYGFNDAEAEDQALIDASLISAAPQLLDALIQAKKYIKKAPMGVFQQIDSAIKKATNP